MDTNLCERLKKAREDAGLTQDEAAKRLGIAIPTLSRYEQGHRTPDADMLLLMVRLFKCDAGWLLTGEGPSRPISYDIHPDETDPDLMWRIIGEIHNAMGELGMNPQKLSDTQKETIQHLLYFDAVQKHRMVDKTYAKILCHLTYCQSCEEDKKREKILGTSHREGKISLLVKTKSGEICPMEGKPREYIKDAPVEVPDTPYYIRLIDDGSLILLETIITDRHTTQKPVKMGSHITQSVSGKGHRVAGRDINEGSGRAKK